MEAKMRVMGGVENCHVSLQLPLLQTLESSHPHQHLPHFLPLQFCSLSDERLWHLSWSGSSSSSPTIESRLTLAKGKSKLTVANITAMEEQVKNLQEQMAQMFQMMQELKEQSGSSRNGRNGGDSSILGTPPNQNSNGRPLGYVPKLEFPSFVGTSPRVWI